MPIDVLTDETLTLAEAAKRIPGHPHPSTVWRWCRRGVRGVRLEYTRIGSVHLTSEACIRKFTRDLTDRDRASESNTPAPKVPRDPRERDLQDAEAALAAEGL